MGSFKSVAAIVAVALTLTGCASSEQITVTPATTTTTSQAEANADYAKNTLAPLIDDIASSFKWIGAAVQSLDFADARAGCRELTQNVNELGDALPSPTPAATYQLEEVVSEFRKFARECEGISPRTSKAQLDTMSGYRDAGQRSLDRAIDALKQAS